MLIGRLEFSVRKCLSAGGIRSADLSWYNNDEEKDAPVFVNIGTEVLIRVCTAGGLSSSQFVCGPMYVN